MVFRLSDSLARDEGGRSNLETIFEHEPVPLDVFVQDKKFLGNPPLSDKQFEVVRHIERIYLPELYPLMAEGFGGYWADTLDTRMTNLITCQWGKGGGKDHTVRVGSLRVAYLLLCLRSPQQYFSMPDQDSIHMLNIAANAGQANRAFFKPMTEAVKRGWFKDYADPKRDTIEFAKNIEAVSGHSEAEGQEGLNIILGVADEIDAFKAKSEMVGQGKKAREASTTAESILEMLKTSASTRFPVNYKRVAISFPRYLGSTIQRLTAEGRKDIEEVGSRSIFFVSGPYATWDVNPRVTGPEQFETDYRIDPDAAAAKYECKPKRATDAYFRNPNIFKASVDREIQPLTISYALKPFRSDVTGVVTTGWEPEFHFQPGFAAAPGARYALHADLAIRGDRAGISLSHVTQWEDREEEVVEDDGFVDTRVTVVPHVRNDFTVSFGADVGETPPREIQIRWARDLVFELVKRGFTIGLVTYDGFQSADSLQMLERHGIPTMKVSTDKDQSIWKSLKDIASDGRLRMAYSDLLQKELEGLSRVGDKIDHLQGGSKDEADAFATSVAMAISVGGEEDSSADDAGEPSGFFYEGTTMEMPLGFQEDLLGLPLGLKGTDDTYGY